VTTILKALEELERRGEADTPVVPAWTADKRRLPWIPIIGVLLVVAGGTIGVVAFNLGRHSFGSTSPTVGTDPARPMPQALKPSSPQAVLPPAPAAPARPAVGMDPASPTLQTPKPSSPQALKPADELPWARLEKKIPAAPPASAPAVPRAAPPSKPQTEVAAPPAAASGPALVPGEPNVQLQSIAYSQNPGGRTVTLRIDGRPTTLHEGESAGGIEVQLILRDAAYLRHGGSVFAVSPGR